MTALGSRRFSFAIYLLVALAALALPIQASEPLHVHHGDIPGLYNGECLLAALAAFHGLAPLPSVALSASFGLVVGATLLHTTAGVLPPPATHTDSRAPPLV